MEVDWTLRLLQIDFPCKVKYLLGTIPRFDNVSNETCARMLCFRWIRRLDPSILCPRQPLGRWHASRHIVLSHRSWSPVSIFGHNMSKYLQNMCKIPLAARRATETDRPNGLPWRCSRGNDCPLMDTGREITKEIDHRWPWWSARWIGGRGKELNRACSRTPKARRLLEKAERRAKVSHHRWRGDGFHLSLVQ